MPVNKQIENPFSTHAPNYAEVKVMKGVENFDLEIQFSETYRQNMNEHVAIREAKCLQTLFPKVFQPIREEDLFAGRTLYRQIGLGLENASGGPGFYCYSPNLDIEIKHAKVSPEEIQKLQNAMKMWETEATIQGKLEASLPPDVKKFTSNRIAGMGGRLSGVMMDYPKLMTLGLPGLKQEIQKAKANTLEVGMEAGLYTGMLMAIELLEEICHRYADEALGMAAQTQDQERAEELKEMAQVLQNITGQAPQTLREGIQLYWLYSLISGTVNYGRMDIALGDFLGRDLERGELTEASALRLLVAFWQMIADRHIFFNGRVVVGGKGRTNEINADRFALLAMEATRLVLETEPQLTLRFYQGQNPALMAKALDVIAEGRTFPMLYNDDINIPAVMNSFAVDEEEAANYLPFGCGEYMLDHRSVGSPNCGFNMLKALEATLNDGKDLLTGDELGVSYGGLETFKTFDDLYLAYKKQIEHHLNFLAKRQALEYQAENASVAFLFVSMLYDDCIKKGRSVVNRGPVYSGGIVETYGMVNTADSLTAIKKLVYDEKKITLQELVTALAADFIGYETIDRLIQEVPKYGNDDDIADEMMKAVSYHVATASKALNVENGLDYFLVVNINNFDNVGLGNVTAASADGRRAGKPLANGNTPTAGNDVKGVTAFMNSIVKPDPGVHAGYVHNMKFSRRMFSYERPKLEALLKTYFSKGGTQAMITVVSRGDLENAMKEPEKHLNLIVRVGGFSARFVELNEEVQADIIKRTLID